MDWSFEPRRPGAIDLASDYDGAGIINCQEVVSNISQMPSSGMYFRFGSNGPANTCASSEICGNAMLEGENGFRHGHGYSHRVSNCISLSSKRISKNGYASRAYSSKKFSPNMLSWPKQQTGQQPPEMVRFPVFLSSQRNSEEEHSSQCRKLKGDIQVPLLPPYKYSNISMVDKSSDSIPPPSESILNQMSNCNMPKVAGTSGETRSGIQFDGAHNLLLDYLHAMDCPCQQNQCRQPTCMGMKHIIRHISRCKDIRCPKGCSLLKELLLHFSGCREIACPVCMPVRTKRKRNSEGVLSTSDICLLKNGTPPIGTTDNLPPSKRRKLINTSPQSCQTGASMISPLVGDLAPSLQQMSCVYPTSTYARNGIKSRKLDGKAYPSSSKGKQTEVYEAEYENPEGATVADSDKLGKMRRKNTQNVTQQPFSLLQETASDISVLSSGAEVASKSGSTRSALRFEGAHKLLSDYLHSVNCLCQQNQCGEPSCMGMKRIISHISHCKEVHCTMGCGRLKELLDHYRGCREITCPICIPVRIKRKRNSREVFGSDVCLLKADSLSIGTPRSQRPFCPLQGTASDKSFLSSGAEVASKSGNTRSALRFEGAHKILLDYLHAVNCLCQQNQCGEFSCVGMKKIISHMSHCKDVHCAKSCTRLKELLHHYRGCHQITCPICIPVRMKRKRNSQEVSRSADITSIGTEDNLPPPKRMTVVNTFSHPCQIQTYTKSPTIVDLSCSFQGPSSACLESTCSRNGMESRKIDAEGVTIHLCDKPGKMKHESSSQRFATSNIHLAKDSTPPIDTTYLWRHKLGSTSSYLCQPGTSEKLLLLVDQSDSPQGSSQVCPELSTSAKNGTEYRNIDTEPSASLSMEKHSGLHESQVKISEGSKVKLGDKPGVVGQCQEEGKLVQNESFNIRNDGENKIPSLSDGNVLVTKARLPKIKGLCLIDSFTSEKIMDHIRSLSNSVNQENAQAERNRSMEDNEICSLCGMKELILEHPPMYCGLCSTNICQEDTSYYSIGDAYRPAYGGDADTVFCSKCYNACDTTLMAGNVAILKTNLEKKRDSDDIAELWVHCDKCQASQHQICALFNGEANKDVLAGIERICPSCFLQEMEAGLCNPLPQSEVLSAENLPTTKLSNHLEEWLFKRLRKERQDRATSLKKSFDEVPAVEGLVVRVVSSVDKKLTVKEDFRRIFQEKEYPTQFPYKSKAIFLFQKFEGADVCLFGMYVQEFGSACPLPNQRNICISYIDSINYFRPEIKSATGEALRTFVYHEILIGYLAYCKQRGFTSCYIWSCPPQERDDYIFYRHPTTQKIPKPSSLQGWYERVIRKAKNENIVVEQTNLYDHYFKASSDCKAKITASHLPYFDGDYWPQEAENLLQEGQKKGNMTMVKRFLKAAKREFSRDNMKDILLMRQLGEKIQPLKKNFIMVHLQHTCKHCCQHIVSGSRWVCKGRTNFHLCDK